MLLASCTSIQIGAALARGTFPVAGALGAAGWRFLLAGVAMLAVTRPRLWAWSRTRWRSVIAFGVAAAVNEVCLYEALARLPLGMAVTLEFLGPIAIALAGAHGRRQILCALLALGGVATICLTRVALDPAGVAFALAAAVGWGAYILASERAGRDDRPIDSLAVCLAIAALLTLPLTITHAPTVAGDPTVLLTLIAVAVLGTVTPYTLEMGALRRVTPSTAGVLFSVEPAIAALVGLLVLGQGLQLAQLAGIVVVVTAGANILRDTTP